VFNYPAFGVIHGRIMSSDTLEERLTRLESMQDFQNTAIAEQRIDAKEIKVTLNDIRTSMAVYQQACMQCRAVPSLEPRVRALEDDRNKAFGGWKMATMMAGIAVLLIKAAFSYFQSGHL
jgi:hypothetical protein